MASTAQQPEEVISAEVMEILSLEQSLADTEAKLMQNEEFKQFLEMQKSVTQRISGFWKEVEARMITLDIKSIKGDWGTLTIAERLNWQTNEDLPAKFYKKVVDTKRISDTFRLEGKAPKGAEPSYTKYLTKRIKGNLINEIYGEEK